MLRLIDWGLAILETMQQFVEWLFRPVASLGNLMGLFGNFIIDVASIFGLDGIAAAILNFEILPFGSVMELFLYGGFLGIIGFKVVKFFTDLFA